MFLFSGSARSNVFRQKQHRKGGRENLRPHRNNGLQICLERRKQTTT